MSAPSSLLPFNGPNGELGLFLGECIIVDFDVHSMLRLQPLTNAFQRVALAVLVLVARAVHAEAGVKRHTLLWPSGATALQPIHPIPYSVVQGRLHQRWLELRVLGNRVAGLRAGRVDGVRNTEDFALGGMGRDLLRLVPFGPGLKENVGVLRIVENDEFLLFSTLNTNGEDLLIHPRLRRTLRPIGAESNLTKITGAKRVEREFLQITFQLFLLGVINLKKRPVIQNGSAMFMKMGAGLTLKIRLDICIFLALGDNKARNAVKVGVVGLGFFRGATALARCVLLHVGAVGNLGQHRIRIILLPHELFHKGNILHDFALSLAALPLGLGHLKKGRRDEGMDLRLRVVTVGSVFRRVAEHPPQKALDNRICLDTRGVLPDEANVGLGNDLADTQTTVHKKEGSARRRPFQVLDDNVLLRTREVVDIVAVLSTEVEEVLASLRAEPNDVPLAVPIFVYDFLEFARSLSIRNVEGGVNELVELVVDDTAVTGPRLDEDDSLLAKMFGVTTLREGRGTDREVVEVACAQRLIVARDGDAERSEDLVKGLATRLDKVALLMDNERRRAVHQGRQLRLQVLAHENVDDPILVEGTVILLGVFHQLITELGLGRAGQDDGPFHIVIDKEIADDRLEGSRLPRLRVGDEHTVALALFFEDAEHLGRRQALVRLNARNGVHFHILG